MTKTDLVDQVAGKTNMTKKDSAIVIDAVLSTITDTLASGDRVQLIGFGTFEVRQRSERIGRNPQTGDQMTIPAKKVPAFKPGKQLKDAIEQ